MTVKEAHDAIDQVLWRRDDGWTIDVRELQTLIGEIALELFTLHRSQNADRS